MAAVGSLSAVHLSTVMAVSEVASPAHCQRGACDYRYIKDKHSLQSEDGMFNFILMSWETEL
jgi:hypothetical protein